MSDTQTIAAPPKPLVDRLGQPASTLWDLDPDAIHINHGSFGAVPTKVQDYQIELKHMMESSPVGWFGQAPERIGQAREQTARLLGTDEQLLAFVPNASGGASVVEQAVPLEPGDEIVVTDHGYGAVVMGAERKAKRTGARVKVVHIPIGACDSDVIDIMRSSLSERTKFVIIDQITSGTSTLLPVKDIVKLAHSLSARVLVDGAHAPGLIKADPRDLGADYWIGNLHKFICAPRGCAVLVASPEVAQDLNPLIDSWWPYEPYPLRFDMQGTLDQTSFLAAPFTIEYLDRMFGWDELRRFFDVMVAYGQQLIAAAFEQITGESHQVAIASPAPAMRLVRLPTPLGDNHDDADLLRNHVFEESKMEVAISSFDGVGYLRLSAHAYNTAADYEAFAERCVPLLCKWAREGRHH